MIKMKGMIIMNDEKQMKELLQVLSEISKSVKSIANSLFWLLHKDEVQP